MGESCWFSYTWRIRLKTFDESRQAAEANGFKIVCLCVLLESKSLALNIAMCQNGGLFSFAGHNAGATKATQNEPLSIPVNNPIAVPHIIPYVTPFNEFRL